MEKSREFAFSAADFDKVKNLIRQMAGISLSEAKTDMVYSRLARRVRECRLGSIGDYLKHVETSPDFHPERQKFLNALTTNLTSFFREKHHFEILCSQVSEQLSQGRRYTASQPFLVWSSACSTGEEAYSLCIALGSVLPVGSFKVFASDIDTDVLAKAKEGVYSMESAAGLDEGMLRKHFLRGSGSNEGLLKVGPDLAQSVDFFQCNLLKPIERPGLRGLDAIFCRNVMIYFDKPTQLKVLENLSRTMQPNGLLYAGHSESFVHASHLFTNLGKTVYKLSQAPTAGR